MNAGLCRLIDSLAGLHIVVIGEAMLDSYLEGSADRLCPEAPVPVVSVSNRRDVPGGAANTAVNVHSLGGRVSLLSVTGQDIEGLLLRRALEDRGVPTQHVWPHPSRRTLSKQRLSADSQLLLRFDQGSTDSLDVDTEQELVDQLHQLVPCCDAVVVSDYGYGILTPRVIGVLGELQANAPRVLVVDSKRQLTAFRQVGATAVKPNYHEIAQALGAAPPSNGARADWMAAGHGEAILELTGAKIAAVTLDSEGALVFERGSPPYRTYATPARNARAVGAGDTFIGAFALALAAQAPTPAAAELASSAAALVVSKDGTAACSAQELREFLTAEGKYLPDCQRLADRVAFLQQQGRRIVFTNGCFDILHRGHITYLSRARALGDVLIVGVNSDASIQRLKGPDRPINPLEDRIQVLTALSCIDHIVHFDEDTPCNLIQIVKPQVFVKGGDYTRERLPEAPLVEAHGGVVHILPLVDHGSTTCIIDRIRGLGGLRKNGENKPRTSVPAAQPAS